MYPTVVESGLRLEQDERGWLYLVRRDGSRLTPGLYLDPDSIAPAEPKPVGDRLLVKIDEGRGLPVTGESWFGWPGIPSPPLPENPSGFEYTLKNHWGEYRPEDPADTRTLRERIAALPPLDVRHLAEFSSAVRHDPALGLAAAEQEILKSFTEKPVPVKHGEEGVVGYVEPGSAVVKNGQVTADVVVCNPETYGHLVGDVLARQSDGRSYLASCEVEGMTPGEFPVGTLTITSVNDQDDGCDAPTVVGG